MRHYRSDQAIYEAGEDTIGCLDAIKDNDTRALAILRHIEKDGRLGHAAVVQLQRAEKLEASTLEEVTVALRAVHETLRAANYPYHLSVAVDLAVEGALRQLIADRRACKQPASAAV